MGDETFKSLAEGKVSSPPPPPPLCRLSSVHSCAREANEVFVVAVARWTEGLHEREAQDQREYDARHETRWRAEGKLRLSRPVGDSEGT